ncbi:phosphoribosylglycinamide formyltransferase [Marichromatium bheemlicum]|uniref:Phosphoribosylglycinamide formyltransferase n=1 Tax=Marichromatium bheemlicum TaxID=365339 RepID=A0ABX1I6J3_9GAMM|nr:phosphoribosylglycinamide formyltransferase [Marichromatium bheemlicum]NKN32569.1 phosphoribosylglycinamide formyltransferase [Marichromatium bheemlicum]
MGEAQQALPVVVLISGGGSNLQALIDGQGRGELPIRIVAVISNRAEAGGLERARRHGIATAVLDHRDYAERADYDAALTGLIADYDPGLVVLAGFMRILTPAFVAAHRGRLLNIHPSLLPKYRGLNTHQRALDAGDREHGASVHFVTAELDGGPVVLQARVPIHPDDDAERLAARVLTQEHIIYPTVVRWFAQRRLRLDDEDRAWLDDEPLSGPRILEAEG